MATKEFQSDVQVTGSIISTNKEIIMTHDGAGLEVLLGFAGGTTPGVFLNGGGGDWSLRSDPSSNQLTLNGTGTFITNGPFQSGGTVTFDNVGEDSTDFTGETMLFPYKSNPNNYRHRIATRHHGGQDTENAIDFYVWNHGTDAITDVGTKRVLTLDGEGTNGTVNVLGDLDVVGEFSTISMARSTGGTRQAITTTDTIVGNALWNGTIITDNTTKSSLITWQSGTTDFLINRAGMYRIDLQMSLRQRTGASTTEDRYVTVSLRLNGSAITGASVLQCVLDSAAQSNTVWAANLIWLDTFAVNDELSVWVDGQNTNIAEVAGLRFIMQSV